jgi:CheY-like chemotaxis protein
MGYCNLLAEDVGDKPGLLEEVDGILSASRKAVNLTRQLLAFSRKQALEPKLIDINKSLAELEKMTRRLLNENIHLRFLLESHRPNVNIDPGQFEQVLINLIVNAKDAMPGGGTLLVQTSDVRADGRGKEYGIPPGDWVMISVRDTGDGIAPENLQRIFEPFFSTKSAQQGTGLGLSTVYTILTQSGGHITVESEPGKGSIFHVYLPLAPGLPEDPELTKTVASGKREGTILLVEDDDHLRMILYRMLEKAGYRVVEASNPKDAIEVAAKEKDFLLLTDIGMPGMTGYELAELLAAGRQQLKVLFMSGYHNKKSPQEDVAYSRSVFLQKPFTNEQLMLALASLD